MSNLLQDPYQINQMSENYDLVIVGAGCMGVASAYYAARSSVPKICLIQKSEIGSSDRYWSSSFSARQNRVQYNEEYLTRFVVQSNKEWKCLTDNLNGVKNGDQNGNKRSDIFLHKEGALWFGDKNTTTNQGNIKAANAVITRINSGVKNYKDRIQSSYMQKIMQDSPEYMKAFKPVRQDSSPESQWDSWSALYQPDGGSVNMQLCYKRMLQFITNQDVITKDKTQIKSYAYSEYNEYQNQFQIIEKDGVKKSIHAKKVLVSVGVYTPFFLRDIMNYPYLAQNQDEFLLEEYVASYIKIKDCKDCKQSFQVMSKLPNYYNFLSSQTDGEQWFSAYGFRFHQWDNLPSQSQGKFVKMGTMANVRIKTSEQLKKLNYDSVSTQDDRVKAAIRFVKERMKLLQPEDKENKHYPCPIIFYPGRQTVMDYLNRNQKSVVVQSGGWIGKYFPLLAKTAIKMLFDPQGTDMIRKTQGDVIGNFINKTRFPITAHVKNKLKFKTQEGVKKFDTIVVGAGCSGLFTTYRLNEAKRNDISKPICDRDNIKRIGNIGVFDLSDRISGRLKSFYFRGVSTPIQLGGMRYIPTNHVLVNHIITKLGIPFIKFPMNGDPIQDHSRKAYLRNDYYNMDEWATVQKTNKNLHTAYRIGGPILGMDAFQIISFSLYMIFTAPENLQFLKEIFLEKTDAEIQAEKKKIVLEGGNAHSQKAWYRNYKNYVYQEQDTKNFFVNLNLRQWNQLKPVALFRFRYDINNKELYLGQKQVPKSQCYPLYKFGFQNVIQAQFGHEAYQFVAEQNGYFSNTSNASYLDQVMTYVLDFGNVTYRTLAGGFDQINYSIANQLLSNQYGFADQTKQGIYLQHRLVDVIPTGNQLEKYIAVFQKPLVLGGEYPDYPTESEPQMGITYRKKDCLEIRFLANNLIFGMPRQSVENLFNGINLFKKDLEQNYRANYETQKSEFYQIFDYPKWNQAKNYLPLTLNENKQLNKLLYQQEISFTDSSSKLTPEQQTKLDQLSTRKLMNQIGQVPTPQQGQDQKNIFEADQPITPKNLHQLASATQIMPSIRIVMNFDRNWWDPNNRINQKYNQLYKNTNLVNSAQQMRGVSVTDLPVRQTLYFSQGQDNLLLGSYNDMITTEFWSTLGKNFSQVWCPASKIQNRIDCCRITKKILLPHENIYHAKTVMVKQLIKQLSQIHQLEVKEEWLKECVYQYWGGEVFGGGYHNFYSGYYIPSVMKTMRKPWSDQNIHIIGQAYSNETGWVQGAYQTSQKMLEQHFQLPPLVDGYYAGY